MREKEIRARIEEVLRKKEKNLEEAYTSDLEHLIEELRTYQIELEFQNDELRSVQQKLETSENKFRLLFEQVPVGYVVINVDFEVLICNKEAARLMACNEIKSGRNKDFRQVILPSMQDDFYQFIRSLPQGASQQQFECVLINQVSEQQIPVMIQAAQNNESKNEWLLAIIDQSAQKAAEAELAQKEITLQTINENMADMLVLSNSDGEIEFASPSCKMFGYTQEEMIGKSLFDFVYADDLSEIIKRFSNALQSGRADQVEFRSPRKDGSLFWVSVNGNFIDYKAGEGGKAVFVVRDIDKTKQVEAALKASEQQFRSLFENNHAVMLLIDPENLDIIDANPAAVNFYGYTYEQLKKMKISDINTLDQEQVFQKAKDAMHKQYARNEFQHKLANGQLKDVESFAGLVYASDKKYLYAIIHDITDKKLAEAKLIENAIALNELNLTKDKLFSVIAHDLRNPIGLMLNLVEMYTEEKEDYSEEEKNRMLKAMHKTAVNTYELLENLLAWSRLQRKHIKPVFQESDLYEHVAYCLASVESTALKKQLLIKSNIPRGFKAQLDLNIFEIVFRNLLSNAIKFSNPGQSIALNAAFDLDENLIFSITDHGIGMDESMLNNLFSLDNETGRPGTAGEKSTGLGLVICKDMMNLINGKIEVKSKPGKGTIFTLTIPQTGV